MIKISLFCIFLILLNPFQQITGSSKAKNRYFELKFFD